MILFFSKYKQLTSYLTNYKVIDNLSQITDDCDILIMDVENIDSVTLDGLLAKTKISVVGICEDVQYNEFFFKFTRIILAPCNIKYFIYVINQLMFGGNLKQRINPIIKESIDGIIENGVPSEVLNALLIQLNYYDESFDFVRTYETYRHIMHQIRSSSFVEINVNLELFCSWQKRDILMIIIILSQIQQPNVHLKVTRERNGIKFYVGSQDVARSKILDYLIEVDFIYKSVTDSFKGLIYVYSKI
jgi:hypothetical protein